MSSPIDRALERRRIEKRRTYKSNREDARITGFGSVILGRIREEAGGEVLDDLRLYSGLSDIGELLIYRHVTRKESAEIQTSFSILEDGALIGENVTTTPEDYDISRQVINSPEDFLDLDPVATESLYDDMMREGFWDRVAFKNAHNGKPGYDNIWKENVKDVKFNDYGKYTERNS